MKQILLILSVIYFGVAQGQFVEIPIGPAHTSHTSKAKKNSNARVQADSPLTLPFWDDFSFSNEPDVPHDSIWRTRKSVWVNNGIGINPPSIYSATFDGIDSTGKPYNIIDVLGKGFADRLISKPIDLSNLSASQKDSVYMSFFYQVTGRGEAPDLDDNFSLWFRDVNGTWEKVFEIGNSITIDPTKFFYKIVKVDAKYFHSKFQFKFQNFARLSGPYDTWNLDYIYLNKRRTANDIYFHDQSLTKSLTSIFKQYRAMPIKHFKDTASTVLIKPKAGFYNLYKFDAQSFKYSSSARVADKVGDIVTVQDFVIEAVGDPQTVLPKFTHLDLELNKTVPLSSLNLSADSIHIDFKLGFDSGDKNIVPETPLFQPLDFTLNDTVQSEFVLSKYYAYDDGTAEYGAGLNRPGAQLAYQFDMYTKSYDTIVAVGIYFPQFGDNSSQTIILKVWSDNGGLPSSDLYRQTITVQRTTSNQLVRFPLTIPVGVKKRFYLGWEQSAATSIPVGLDKNNNSGNKMFFNITGAWEQNQNVIGSLMIRPVFGRGPASVIDAVEQKGTFEIFPNPTSGDFNIPIDARNVSIHSTTGSRIDFDLEKGSEHQIVKIQNPVPGLYILRFALNETLQSTRVLVRN